MSKQSMSVLDFFPVYASPEHLTQNDNLTNQKLHNLHFRLNLQEQMFVLPESLVSQFPLRFWLHLDELCC